MTKSTDITSPMMEFRETARRFAWLCLVLAVISLITTVANETFGPFGLRPQVASETSAPPAGFIARR